MNDEVFEEKQGFTINDLIFWKYVHVHVRTFARYHRILFSAILFAGKINFNRGAREVKIYERARVSSGEKRHRYAPAILLGFIAGSAIYFDPAFASLLGAFERPWNE